MSRAPGAVKATLKSNGSTEASTNWLWPSLSPSAFGAGVITAGTVLFAFGTGFIVTIIAAVLFSFFAPMLVVCPDCGARIAK